MTSSLPSFTSAEYDPDSYQMGLMAHLRELRKRLFLSLMAVAIGACVAYYYAPVIFSILCAPYFSTFIDSPLIGTSPAEAWVMKIKVSIFASLIGTSPFLFYQLWLFVAPGLHNSERKFAVPFVVTSSILFALGTLFCYLYVLPVTFAFFRDEFVSIGVTPNVRIGDHLSMTITTLVGFGVVFELPILTFFLARAGVLDHKDLIAWSKHAIVGIFIVAAVLTPPDVLTQFLMAGPLVILYALSIGIAWLFRRRDTENSES